jgi:hypothetical protein
MRIRTGFNNAAGLRAVNVLRSLYEHIGNDRITTIIEQGTECPWFANTRYA